MGRGDWIAFVEDSRRPHGQRCLYCGCQDIATESRLYVEGQYQICQQCHYAETAIIEFSSCYSSKILSMKNSAYREYLEEEKAFHHRWAYRQGGYHCSFCGERLRDFGKGIIGQRPVTLFSCCCPTEEGMLYLPRSDGGGCQKASPLEAELKREAIMESARKRLGERHEITPMEENELSSRLKSHGFLTTEELFRRKSIQDVLRSRVVDGMEFYPAGDRDTAINQVTRGMPSIRFGLYPSPAGRLVIIEILKRLREVGAKLAMPEPYPLKRLREFLWQRELFEPERYALYYYSKDDPATCYGIAEEVEFIFCFADIKHAQRGAGVFDAL